MTDKLYVTTAAGVAMPRMLYGTAWKKEQTADLVVRAVELGFRGIDTACQPKHYHEAGVGDALRRLHEKGIARSSLFIQTKFTPLAGQDPKRLPYDPEAPLAEQVKQSFATSQKNLGTDYVDSLVLHSPLRNHAHQRSVWRAMEGIYDQGGAKQLGISNCYELSLLQELCREVSVKPAVVQNRFYEDSAYDTSLRQWCSKQGMIYQSFWTLTANPHILKSKALSDVAQEYGKTAPQIFFRFLTQQGVVPLTGTCSEQHMQEDLSIFDFELQPAALESIARLLHTA